MAKYAVVKNGMIINIVEANAGIATANGWIPANSGAKIGDIIVNGQIVPVAEKLDANKVDPIKFQLLFTFAERLAIRAAASTDPGCKELLRMLDDPRLVSVDLGLKSTQDAIDYLEAGSYIAAGRKAEILAGVIK